MLPRHLPRLTTQGWRLLAAAVLLGTAGYIFSIFVLLAIAVAAIAIVVTSIAYVSLRPPLQLISQSLQPKRMHSGSHSHITTRLCNPSRWSSPVLRLNQNISYQPTLLVQSPGLIVPPVKPGQQIAVTYDLPTQQRGKAFVGPVTISITDPLAIALRKFQLGKQLQAWIYPILTPLTLPTYKLIKSADAMSGSPAVKGDEELYGLRPFQTGDDPRHIHWRSSAHQGEIIVRQFEQGTQTRTTVLLDTVGAQRSHTNNHELFEAMVTTAASFCNTAQKNNNSYRLTTTSNFDSGYGSHITHLHHIYEYLALVTPETDIGNTNSNLIATIKRLNQEHTSGVVVAVTAEMTDADVQMLRAVAPKLNLKTLVVVDSVGLPRD